jgi:hypothetical protein
VEEDDLASLLGARCVGQKLVIGAVLRGRGLVGREGLGVADLEVLLRAEAADAEDGDEGGGDGDGVVGGRVGPRDGACRRRGWRRRGVLFRSGRQ